MLIAALIEAPIAVWSDRGQRTRVYRFAVAALSLALALCAVADRAWILSLGLSLAGAASGVACTSAEGELIARSRSSSRAMSLWASFASVGDVIVPLVVGAVLFFGGTYRAALALVAVCLGVQVLLSLRPFSLAQKTRQARHGQESLTGVARSATANAEARAPGDGGAGRAPQGGMLLKPRLWLLLFATAVCSLLDEVAVAFVSLRMVHDLRASPMLTAFALSVFAFGVLIGSGTTRAWVHRASPQTVLAISACVSMASLTVIACVRDPVLAPVVLFVLGASAAPHYPLLKAAAYDLVPRRPGLVNAAAQVFVVVEMLLPLAVGFVAVRYGLAAGLVALMTQPLFVLLMVVFVLRRA